MRKGFRVQPLCWSGHSNRKRMTLNHLAARFAEPSPIYEKIGFCQESVELLQSMNTDSLLALEERLLDGIDHSANLTPYLGTIDSDVSEQIKTATKTWTLTIIELLKLLVRESCDGPELQRLFESMPAQRASRLRSVLQTSLHNYTQIFDKNIYQNVLNHPLFLETAIDIMVSGKELMMSEFQVRYSAPYPHVLEDLNRSFQQEFAPVFQNRNLLQEEYPRRRQQMLGQALDLFAQALGQEPKRLVIDGWAYLENAGANWKRLAENMNADYVLFDDLDGSGDEFRDRNQDVPLFIFNQVPLYQLDPAYPAWERFNQEGIELYELLRWNGLAQRYFDGQMFLCNSPASDIVNDKALYEFLPELAKFFFDEKLEFPLAGALPCWREDSPEEFDEGAIAWALQQQEKCVLSHRYLEGGAGIRIGAAMSREEWESFIGSYVVDRPYLYIVREYFQMDPDVSIRLLTSSLAPSMVLNSPTSFTCSDTYLARFSAEKPLTMRNSRCFLLVPERSETN